MTMTTIGKDDNKYKGKDKHKRSKTKRKVDEACVDAKALAAELEPNYIVKRYYDIGPVYCDFCLFFMGTAVIMFFVLPCARNTARGAFVFWSFSYVLRKYTSRYKGTKHEEYGFKLRKRVIQVAMPMHEIFEVSYGTLASEEGRKAHASMVMLVLYLLAAVACRVNIPRDKDGPVVVIILTLIAWKYPRFGIFSPCYEALAFFVVKGLGWLFGTIIDEMAWRHYLLMYKKDMEIQKKTKELSKESRKRAMAMEALLSYTDKSSFFEIY